MQGNDQLKIFKNAFEANGLEISRTKTVYGVLVVICIEDIVNDVPSCMLFCRCCDAILRKSFELA